MTKAAKTTNTKREKKDAKSQVSAPAASFISDMEAGDAQNTEKEEKRMYTRPCASCGRIIVSSTRGRRYCDACLERNVQESKRRYENKRRQASMSEPKRAAITRNRQLQIVIRNMEHACAMANDVTSLSSFNRWSNGQGRKQYTEYAKECLCAFLRQYLSSENGNPLARMTNITRAVPEIRSAYIMECIRRQKEAGFETMGEFQQYERNNLKAAGEWRADLVCEIAGKNFYILNPVDFSDAGLLLDGNGGWR
jgi:hypothetical protein